MNSTKNRIYIAIDLKSFYASVECRERGLDPLTTNLVVADPTRTEKTICLAVTPSLKAYGIPGRVRLFELIQKVREVNIERAYKAGNHKLTNTSYDDCEIKNDKTILVDYIVAPPRMALYMEYSTRIYNIYLKYIAPEDIHVYSIDEVFMDVTDYLHAYQLTSRELAMKIIQDVLQTTGITATVGIGTNLYLAKIAMDIVAKHIEPDKNGVRIAELDEMSYRHILWNHRPITDFWRVGKGYAKKLEEKGLFTMGDVARCSLGTNSDFYNEELLYKMFGINAELLIDHAWGWEPCTIKEIKAYKPQTNSMGSGQVLLSPYDSKKARLIVHEMIDLLVLEMVDRGLVTDQVVLTIGYDIENIKNQEIRKNYCGEIIKDGYGREIPKPSHGTNHLKKHTSSSKEIIAASMELYDRIINNQLLVRRINITLDHVIAESSISKKETYVQMDLFTNYEEVEKQRKEEVAELRKEKKIQKALLDIKKKYGNNAILKGMNFEEGAMTRDRNNQIGGHKA